MGSSRRRAQLRRPGRLSRRALGIVLSLVTTLPIGILAPGARAEEDPPAAPEAPAPAAPPESAKSSFRSDEDGWVDFSNFLDKAYGFFPLLVPITEPAVGYGAAGALVFIGKPDHAAPPGLGRPNLTLVGGLATANDTWGVMAADIRHWKGDRVQTVAGLVHASINLDFYGVGHDEELEDHPLRYNLEPLGGGVRGRYRLGDSRLWAGLSYALANTRIEFDDPSRLPATLEVPEDSRVGGLTPSLAYDSRDNLFTPNAGTYIEGTAGLFDEAFGGDDSFQRVGLIYIKYWRLRPDLTLGVRGGGTFAFGDTPFYMLPYITLRGAPIVRYQGEDVAEVETEARWQFWKRFSLVGFAGAGGTWNDFQHLDNETGILTGGAGFRYEVARKYGIHAGLDVAYGPDGPALYIQFGSAWARP